MPRLSSPLNAKASVRSPYALDRSQQNPCVGTVCHQPVRSGRQRPHMRFDIVFADNDVFSGPSSKLQGEPDKPFNSRCQFSATGEAGIGNLILSTIACASDGGGARRDRTDDLMLAKHALYQLSYGPIRSRSARAVVRPIRPRIHKEVWWAQADSNRRPHAYQACALTS